jgi:hypothetical protein
VNDEETSEYWLEEYGEGMTHEIYRVKLSEKLERKYFSDISRIIYKKTKAVVFAIEVNSERGKPVIRLNPNDFLVNNIKENDIHVYAICRDKVTAESIETIEMNKEEKSRYFINKDLKTKEDKKFLEEWFENGNYSSSDDDAHMLDSENGGNGGSSGFHPRLTNGFGS